MSLHVLSDLILNEILKTPIGREIRRCPLILHVEKSQHVASLLPEILVGCVGVDDFIPSDGCITQTTSKETR